MSRVARLLRSLVAPLRSREGRAAAFVFGFVCLAYLAQFRRALPIHPKPGLPSRAIDSGVNELLVECDADVTLETLELIDDTVHDRSLR